MKHIIKILLLCLIACILNSCNGFRGLAGPTFVKLYNDTGGQKEIQNALNSFYHKYPETIIKYEDWVAKGFVSNDSIKDKFEQGKYERGRFHVTFHYNFPNNN